MVVHGKKKAMNGSNGCCANLDARHERLESGVAARVMIKRDSRLASTSSWYLATFLLFFGLSST